MTCKGICYKYKALGKPNQGKYINGQKRCQICEIFLKWGGLWCPCCGYRLRCNPRGSQAKRKLRGEMNDG